MKKVLVLVLMATTLVACENSELESAEETIIVMKEKEKSKEQSKQTTDWKLFNSKLIGAKDDAPQGTQADYPKDGKKDDNKEEK